MAQLASDNFDRADNTVLGSSWTDCITNGTPFAIATNQASSAAAGADKQAFYNGVTWPDNHYSQVTIATTTTSGANGAGNGVSVRQSSSTTVKTMYRLVVGSTGYEFGKFDGAGSFTSISSGSGTTFASSDVLKLEFSGTTYRAYKNGTQFLTGTDALLSSGNAGLAYSSTTGTTGLMDNWSGGDAAAQSFVLGKSNFFANLMGM
jgi:hypothetical protein